MDSLNLSVPKQHDYNDPTVERDVVRLHYWLTNLPLMDVVERIDQVERWSECLLGLPKCSGKNPCALHEKWGALRDGYLSLLRNTSIADLL